MIEIIPNWHPLLVHFTIALLLASVGLFLLASLFKSHKWHDQWLSAANWNLWLGSGFAVLTALAGWYAYNTVAHDTPSHAAMTEHRNWAIATLLVIFIIAIWSITRYRARKLPNAPFLAVAVVVGALLMTTGWHGAEAVYRYGLGVMSLPQAEGEGHAHEHADGEAHDEMATDMHDEADGHGHDGDEVDDHQSMTPSTSTDDNHGHDDEGMTDVHGKSDAENEAGDMHTHADGKGHDEMATDMHDEADGHGHDGDEVDDHQSMTPSMSTDDNHGHDDEGMTDVHGKINSENEEGDMHTHADGTMERH